MGVTFGPGPVCVNNCCDCSDIPTSRVGVSVSSTSSNTVSVSTWNGLSSTSGSSGGLDYSSPQASTNTPAPRPTSTTPLTTSSTPPTIIPSTFQTLGTGQTTVSPSTTITDSPSFRGTGASSTIRSNDIQAMSSDINTSYTSGLPAVISLAPGSDPHAALNKGQIIGITVGIGAAIAVISAFAFYISAGLVIRLSHTTSENMYELHGTKTPQRWPLQKFNMTGS